MQLQEEGVPRHEQVLCEFSETKGRQGNERVCSHGSVSPHPEPWLLCCLSLLILGQATSPGGTLWVGPW